MAQVDADSRRLAPEEVFLGPQAAASLAVPCARLPSASAVRKRAGAEWVLASRPLAGSRPLPEVSLAPGQTHPAHSVSPVAPEAREASLEPARSCWHPPCRGCEPLDARSRMYRATPPLRPSVLAGLHR